MDGGLNEAVFEDRSLDHALDSIQLPSEVR